MKLIKPPKLIKNFYKDIIWDIPNCENTVFFTFDDCCDEDLTLWTLNLLKQYNAKATFFCTGECVEKNKLYLEIIKEKQELGNHGYKHLNGFRISKNDFFKNALKNNQIYNSKLFRPPYGKIKPNQILEIQKNFKIIMWSIMSYDFDFYTSPQKCFENVKKNIFEGAIIVFHTNKKSRKNLKFALQSTIDFLLAKNYKINSFISDFL